MDKIHDTDLRVISCLRFGYVAFGADYRCSRFNDVERWTGTISATPRAAHQVRVICSSYLLVNLLQLPLPSPLFVIGAPWRKITL